MLLSNQTRFEKIWGYFWCLRLKLICWYRYNRCNLDYKQNDLLSQTNSNQYWEKRYSLKIGYWKNTMQYLSIQSQFKAVFLLVSPVSQVVGNLLLENLPWTTRDAWKKWLEMSNITVLNFFFIPSSLYYSSFQSTATIEWFPKLNKCSVKTS